MSSTRHVVARISINGDNVPFTAAALMVTPGDFKLRFRTANYLPPPTADYEIVTADHRVYRGQGVDASGTNPFDHEIVHGQGDTGFVE